MAIRAIATDSCPLERCQSLDVWHRGHKCPETGSGQRLVHKWILSAANACKHFGLPIESAHTWIEERMSREPDSNREIPDTLAYAYGSEPGASTGRSREPKAQYSLSKLEERASRIDAEITRDWLQERSPMRVGITPAAFLHVLYRQGESVWIGTRKHERRGSTWINDSADDLDCLNFLQAGHEGVWFLANPVDGKPALNGERNQWFPNGETWRTEASVTSWRYMVIESDEAPENLWLRMLVQLHLPISAIYTSGGESVHALVRVDQPSKAAWDQFRDSIKHGLIELGADPGSLTAVRLTRLPGCVRGETGQLQQLLFLNPMASGNSPIIERE
jgi:hypothetical protein